ncbi:MAG: methyltransferase domain-containing protein [Pseudomonadota bacterium]|nr:methyltransferase domain-containing protein [Pseudomonadota bacterium]
MSEGRSTTKPGENPRGIDEDTFQAMIRRIRRRPRQPISGHWLNIVEALGHRFLQGPIGADVRGHKRNGGLAYIGRSVRADDIAGFWPETSGRLLTPEEGDATATFISSLDGGDVELIVPLRNRALPVRWESFEDSREYPLYAAHIHPRILSALSGLPFRRLLDVGCGSGNLLAAIRRDHPEAHYAGVDISPDNVEAAREKGFDDIRQGRGEDVATMYAPEPLFDVIVFCGVLNRQIMDGHTARKILKRSLTRLEGGGHVIITGYSSCHLSARELKREGLTALKKSIPENIFRDYDEFHLRQFYVARKDGPSP